MNRTYQRVVAVLLLLLTVLVSLYIREQLLELTKLRISIAVSLVVLNVIASCFLIIVFFASKKEKMLDSISKDMTHKEVVKKNKIQDTKQEDSLDDVDVSDAVSSLQFGLSAIEKIEAFTEAALIRISKEYPIVQGLFFVKEKSSDWFILKGKYAFYSDREIEKFQAGEGLSGQVAKDKRIMNISNVPKDYITILSGLGKGSPQHLFILPIVENDETIALVELASFSPFTPIMQKTFESLAEVYCSLLANLRQ